MEYNKFMSDFDLNRIPKNRFTVSEFMAAFSLSYGETGKALRMLEENGKITPVKNSGRCAFDASIYNNYRKVKETEDYSDFKSEILRLHPRLVSYYLSHPKQYVSDEKNIVQLSDWLKKEEKRKASVKERSFEIFGQEKFLQSKEGVSLLKRSGLSLPDLSCYETPEPFFMEETAEEGAVLILENKDPWFSLAGVMRGKYHSFLKEEIGVLLYGEGRKAASENLTSFLTSMHLNERKILYCGDIDAAGFHILMDVQKNNPSLSAEPFTALYERMAEKGYRENCSEMTEDEKSSPVEIDWLGQWNDYVNALQKEKKRIPQEIFAGYEYEEMCG